MTRFIAITALLVSVIGPANAWAQADQRDPHIGYLYPAGGRQGATVRVLVGGQFLRGLSGVHVVGEGVTGKVVEFYPPIRNLKKEQREALFRRMADCAQRRWDELVEQGKATGKPPWNLARKPPAPKEGAEPVKLPKHYLLDGWDQMSLRELAAVRQRLTDRRKEQPNAQIAETVLVELTIEPDAAPGDRELRLVGRAGLTNPMVFQVGRLPETTEIERNDPGGWDPLPPEPPVDVPVVINGQVLPGDVDRLRFNARAGQKLVIEVRARYLVPFLADAVPGWFQPVISVHDAQGKELAFADDFRFDPDPVVCFEPPADGVYAVHIRDAIYRGREDFVYRVTISESPYITSLFPLGAKSGEPTEASIGGWNLPANTVTLSGEGEGVRTLVLDGDSGRSNALRYEVSDEAALREREPNDANGQAQPIELPALIDGRIGLPGDVDVYRFEGKAGQRIVAEVIARRLRSPMDSLIRLTDADGKVIAWNDDDVDKRGHLHRTYGVLTHQADSRLSAELPADGEYRLAVSDTTRRGGPACAYRLRIGPPSPDFAVDVGPTSLSPVAGQSAPLTVHVLRRDGFDGPVALALVDAPPGFALDSATVPAGVDRLRITLTAPTQQIAHPFALRIEGRASIDGHTVTRRATPVDDVMQAFLWRHLVPAEQMIVSMIGTRRARPAPTLADAGPLQLPVGGKAVVKFNANLPAKAPMPKLRLTLDEPPAGVSLGPVDLKPNGFAITVVASDEAKAGESGNLIIDVAAERKWKAKDGKERKQVQAIGTLRAVPFVITEQ